MIEAPITDVIATMITPAVFGKRWLKMIRASDAPEARAASTYSRSRSDTKLARTTRAIAGQSTIASVKAIRRTEMFLIADTAISAASRAGIATNASVVADSSRSAQPR